MNSIIDKKAAIWCDRFNQLMKSHGYTQETFLKEYKSKYGGGTQANISRWLRVGSVIKKDGVSKKIGFPSYDNMLKIADFFGVTIGYLTGETDFESFEMEKACQCIGIDEETGEALRDLASGKRIRFVCNREKEIKAALKFLFISDSFPLFISALQECAEKTYYKKHPINYLAKAEKKIDKNILELSYQCLDYQCAYDDRYGEIDDFKDNNVEPTEDLLSAISLLNEAIGRNYEAEMSNEQELKLSEYELQKVYFELIKEVIVDEHLPDMIISRKI